MNTGSPGERPKAASQHTADHFIVWPSGRSFGASASRTASSPPTRSTAARTRACARPGSGCRPAGCWAAAALGLLLGPGLRPGLAAFRLRAASSAGGLLLGLVLPAQLGELRVERVAVLLGGARPTAALGPPPAPGPDRR